MEIQQGTPDTSESREKDLIDDDFGAHLDLDRLIVTGDFTDEEMQEAIRSSESRRDVLNALKSIREKRSH